ncbi:MAG: hypothetical protein AABX11_04900 [Nanoarchaeota archaeon]
MRTCIIVPIKTLNKRLPGKTFKLLDQKPLYQYLFTTLKQALDEKIVDSIMIDSSDKEVLEIARNWGFTPSERPEEFNSDTTAGDQLISRVILNLSEFDIIGEFHITSPFLSLETIKKAIITIKSNNSLDSVFGVVPRYNRFWMKEKPINHDTKFLIRTQDLTPVLEEADFYLFRRESFLKFNKRVSGIIETIPVSKVEGVDIDYLEDFIYAESLLAANLVPNFARLNQKA